MGEIIRTLTDRDKPLCPNSMSLPTHEAHKLRNRVLDAFYGAAEKNPDGEMPEPLDKAYYAAAYGASVSDRMDLYVERVGFTYGREFVSVESWFFRCGTCGFVLPANRVREAR